MKGIIVPVDFSEYSEYALETAAGIAAKFNAKIYILHMLELSDTVFSSTSNALHEEAVFYLKLAEKKLEAFLDKDYLEGLSVTPIVKQFKVFKEINEITKEHDIDLIVMGSHGVSGVKEVIVGSNAEKVVRYSDMPVLIVKHDPVLVDFETGIFASDFSEKSVKPYQKAKALFEKLGCELHLVYVNTPDNGFKSSLEIDDLILQFLKAADGNIDNFSKINVVSDYSVERGILNFANTIGADIVAVATYGRRGLAHFFEGSISEDVANHSTLPVMTFKI